MPILYINTGKTVYWNYWSYNKPSYYGNFYSQTLSVKICSGAGFDHHPSQFQCLRTGDTKMEKFWINIVMHTITTPPTDVSSNPPPDFLDHIPQDADCFINVRVTRRFKNRVHRFSEARGTTVTKTVLTALNGFLEPFC
jgi:hypothetical protein